ncbi:erythromycin esterase family protein [Nocardia brasiliensis]|uniref:erythromycin esterase family protein n=1 Tax=Nocardia brasiliensis TaxID=37326 RepID=UPI0024555129|nr:erythromycin esterase family protein [Nocardia brasiliensis]
MHRHERGRRRWVLFALVLGTLVLAGTPTSAADPAQSVVGWLGRHAVPLDHVDPAGHGDLDTIMSQLGGQWQTQEVAYLLRWLRDFNTGRVDKVRFTGVEYFATGPAAYDGVEAYLAAADPERLAELRVHLQAIRPSTTDVYAHIGWYQGVPDKTPYLEHARRVHHIIAAVPHQSGDAAHELALQHARQIVSFYEHYSLPAADGLVYRDARAAENLRWWREFTGDKVAYRLLHRRWQPDPVVRPDRPLPADRSRVAALGVSVRSVEPGDVGGVEPLGVGG